MALRTPQQLPLTHLLSLLLSKTKIATMMKKLQEEAQISGVPGEKEGARGSLGHAAVLCHGVRLRTSRRYRLITEAQTEQGALG